MIASWWGCLPSMLFFSFRRPETAIFSFWNKQESWFLFNVGNLFSSGLCFTKREVDCLLLSEIWLSFFSCFFITSRVLYFVGVIILYCELLEASWRNLDSGINSLLGPGGPGGTVGPVRPLDIRSVFLSCSWASSLWQMQLKKNWKWKITVF